MVSPAAPEGVDGIRDYTVRLCQALSAAGAEVHDLATRFPSRRPGVSELVALRRLVAALQPCVVHVQHPSAYRFNFAPQALSLLGRGVVTVHEASVHGRLLGRLKLAPYALRSHRLIFTSDYERACARRWFPWLDGRSTTIPLAANVMGGATPTARTVDVAYFGIIRPHKGIEDFLRLSELARAGGESWTVRLVGNAADWSSRYGALVGRRAREAGVQWLSGLDHDAAATALAQARVAYLPFPDGASERRGSLLAAFENGLAVVTTVGNQTPGDIRNAVAVARSPQEGLHVTRRLLNDDGERSRLSEAGRAFAAARPSWSQIAERHMELYRSIGLPGRSR
jgi:glycosyltransferase involved in cell wall biosynthesis